VDDPDIRRADWRPGDAGASRRDAHAAGPVDAGRVADGGSGGARSGVAGEHRAADWTRAAWFGNDRVTLVVALPLLMSAMTVAVRGSVRGLLLWFGVLAYAVYSYLYDLLGVA
jgi:hypothetical protein